MKASRKLLALGLSLLLAIGVMSVCFMTAAEGTPSVSIDYCNLSFRDNVCIKYAVYAENVEAPEENVKLLVWTEPQSEYKVGTQSCELTTVGTQVIEGKTCHVFDYTKLAAKQMTDVIYTRAYVKVDGTEYLSEVNKYSILQYAYNKLGKTGTASTDENLLDMLEQMLLYGAAAQKHFGYHTERLASDPFFQINLEGGSLDDGSRRGLYLAGSEVKLTAPADDGEGHPFSHWSSSAGEMVADTPVMTVKIGENNETYTPVYKANVESRGLSFSSNGDGTCSVTGLGTCADTDIVIPEKSPKGDTVTNISAGAFSNCPDVKSIVIPDSVQTIEKDAFEGCDSLESITVPFVGGSRDYTNSEQSFFGYIFGASAGIYNDDYVPETLKSVTVTDTEGIGTLGFHLCGGLETVILPDKLVYLGGYALSNCSSVTDFDIPNGVTYIGEYAFQKCIGIKSVDIPRTVTKIDSCAFINSGITSATMRAGVEYGSSVFMGCADLESVTIENGVETIPYSTFQNCSSLSSVTIPSTVTSIKENAFGYTAITEITVPVTVTELGEKAFYHCASLGTAVINANITSLGMSMFEGCTSLTSITLPSSLKSMSQSVFSGCGSLESFEMPQGVTTVGKKSFANCTKLSSVTLSSTLIRIGDYAFQNCASLKNISFPSTVSEIGDSAFYECVQLVTASGFNGNTIGPYAFYGCKKLTTTNFGNNIQFINEYAFCGCESMTSFTLPSKAMLVGKYAFYKCTSLKSFYFKNTYNWYAGGNSLLSLGTPSKAAEYMTTSYTKYEWSKRSY